MSDPMPDTSVLIDRWFPVAAVDDAVGNPAGSGANEKSIFPWFASRPIAQARAAVLCALLGDDSSRLDIEAAIRGETDASSLSRQHALGQRRLALTFRLSRRWRGGF
jgi:adenine-specific DNA methylase